MTAPVAFKIYCFRCSYINQYCAEWTNNWTDNNTHYKSPHAATGCNASQTFCQLYFNIRMIITIITNTYCQLRVYKAFSWALSSFNPHSNLVQKFFLCLVYRQGKPRIRGYTIFLWSHCGTWHRSQEMGPISRSTVLKSMPLFWGSANLLGSSAWRYLGEISLVSQYC